MDRKLLYDEILGRKKKKNPAKTKVRTAPETRVLQAEKQEPVEKQDLVERQAPVIVEKQEQPIRKFMYIDVVVDTAYSFGRYYHRFYDRIFSSLSMLVQACEQQKKPVQIRWGLTLIREDRGEAVRFQDELFTPSVLTFFSGLKSIMHVGRDESGNEVINEAAAVSLEKLRAEAVNENYRGMILFTDSLPPVPADGRTDWIGDFCDKGSINFAAMYLLNHETYIPLFSWDWNTEAAKNTLPYAIVDTLEHFLYKEQTGEILVNYILQSIGCLNQEAFI